jgi:putative ABC transport system ATP-binding protein
MEEILVLENVAKHYLSGSKPLTVLENVHFSVRQGEMLSIVGPSGSGKTTLLGLCAGLDKPSEGIIQLCGTTLNPLSEDERAALRNQHVGFIFQNFQLIPTLTAIENVMIPLELNGIRGAEKTALALLNRVNLADRAHHYPAQLSGGEKQRVSLARAFSNDPSILFADEPTGNLDDDTSQSVEDLMFELNREQGTTMIIVTHDLDLARKTERIIQLKGGHIIKDEATATIANTL